MTARMSTKASYKMARNMDLACKAQLKILTSTQESFILISETVLVKKLKRDLNIASIFKPSLANGKMILNTAMEHLLNIQRLPVKKSYIMKVNGKKINNMAWVLRPGQMVPSSKDNMFKERSTVKELSHGLMDLLIPDNLLRIIFKETGNITGQTVENSMDHG